MQPNDLSFVTLEEAKDFADAVMDASVSTKDLRFGILPLAMGASRMIGTRSDEERRRFMGEFLLRVGALLVEAEG